MLNGQRSWLLETMVSRDCLTAPLVAPPHERGPKSRCHAAGEGNGCGFEIWRGRGPYNFRIRSSPLSNGLGLMQTGDFSLLRQAISHAGTRPISPMLVFNVTAGCLKISTSVHLRAVGRTGIPCGRWRKRASRSSKMSEHRTSMGLLPSRTSYAVKRKLDCKCSAFIGIGCDAD